MNTETPEPTREELLARVAVLEAGLRRLDDAWTYGNRMDVAAVIRDVRALLGGVPATKEEQT